MRSRLCTLLKSKGLNGQTIAMTTKHSNIKFDCSMGKLGIPVLCGIALELITQITPLPTDF